MGWLGLVNCYGFFLAKNMVKKGYCRNERFGFAWDHIRLPWVALYVTANGIDKSDTIFQLSLSGV